MLSVFIVFMVMLSVSEILFGFDSQVCESTDDHNLIENEKGIPMVENELPHSIMDDDLEGN